MKMKYSSLKTCLTATETHVPRGIKVLPATQQRWHSRLYHQLLKAGTRFSDQKGCKA